MKFLEKSKFVLVVLLMCLPFAVYAAGDEPTTNGTFDWEPVMNAIIQVESGGNPNAVSGNSCGAMQITPICVAQCNIILKARKSKKRYSLKDRFNIAKSKEMFLLLQSYYNLENNIEKAIRSWNGGMNIQSAERRSIITRLCRISDESNALRWQKACPFLPDQISRVLENYK